MLVPHLQMPVQDCCIISMLLLDLTICLQRRNLTHPLVVQHLLCLGIYSGLASLHPTSAFWTFVSGGYRFKVHWFLHLEVRISTIWANPDHHRITLFISLGSHCTETLPAPKLAVASLDVPVARITLVSAVLFLLNQLVFVVSHLSPRGRGVRPRTTPSVRPPLGGSAKIELWPQMLPFLLPFPAISCSIPVFLRYVGSHPRHQLIKSICSIIYDIELMPQYLCGTEQIKVVSESRTR
jgi:hypothetical protein